MLGWQLTAACECSDEGRQQASVSIPIRRHDDELRYRDV
jgi:hypothetical protein